MHNNSPFWPIGFLGEWAGIKANLSMEHWEPILLETRRVPDLIYKDAWFFERPAGLSLKISGWPGKVNANRLA